MISMPSGPTRAYCSIGWTLLFLFFTLTACGQDGGGKPSAQGSSGGALAFRAVWPEPGVEILRNPAEDTNNTPDVCTAFGIETITAEVVDGSGTKIGTGRWPCDIQDHKGTIGGIPAGGGYQVLVKGLVAGKDAWHGRASNVNINAGRTTAIDKIVMHAFDFVLHASSSDGGRIEPAGSIPASAISVQTFNFIPRSGYEVDDVIVDGTSHGFMERHTISHVDGNHTIYVSFVPTSGPATTRTITATAGGGGAIVPQGPIQVVEGNDQTFAFVPSAGNQIADVFVDGVSLGAMSGYTFGGVDADHTVRVAFDTTTYTISASAGAGGRIEPAGDITSAYGSTPAFTIAADPGFYLADLLVNGVSVLPQSAYTFQPVTDNAAIEAIFKPVRYVDAAAQAGGNGNTWQSAFRNLPDAIEAAGDGFEIWIKAGTYLLSSQIIIDKAVAIYGGHDGDERFAHERDWQENPTIFDGQATTRAFSVSADARLDGLTVRNGTPPTDYMRIEGGGMYIDNSSPTIANCTFDNNRFESTEGSGGAVYADNGAPVFQNCRFENNTVTCEGGNGGAMHLNYCTATITACTFIGNRVIGSLGSSGGGLQVRGGTAVITGSQFIANTTGGDKTLGGAISSSSDALTISGCQFIKNVSNSGMEASYGGALNHNGENAASNPVIRNSIFLHNRADGKNDADESQGGALFNKNAAPFIVNCTFSGNQTSARYTSRGGAIANEAGSPTIINSILWGNHAYIRDGSTTSDGQGMQLHDDAESGSTVSHSVVDGAVPNGNDNLNQAPNLDTFGHLQPGSIGLDAGDDASAPDTDIDGEARPRNGRSDIGADELVDADADRMPDYWERHYGLNIGADDSAADPDGDGLVNLVEYRTGLDPTKANPSTTALERGWYDGIGFHDSNDNSTLCGKQNDWEHRSYFTFQLPPVTGTVVGAVLRLELAGYESIRPNESFSVHEVTTDPVILEASGSGEEAIFDDLGDGVTYAGKMSVTPADAGETVGIVLSAEAATHINAAPEGRFSVGIKATSMDRAINDFITFSQASEARTHQLVLVVE